MNKYINAERLIHDLEERIYAYSEGYADGDNYRKDAIETLLKDVRYQCSLQQEQPVEGLEELRKEVIKFSQDHFDELHSDMETIDIVHIIACHFAEWGAAHARKGGSR